MPLFASTYSPPLHRIPFEVIGEDAGASFGNLQVYRGTIIFRVDPVSKFKFSVATGADRRRSLTTTIEGQPTLMLGRVISVDGNGTTALRVDEIRQGSSAQEQNYVAVTAQFSHLDTLTSCRTEDGEQRSPRSPLELPELRASPAMNLSMVSGSNSVTLTSEAPASFDQFETHLQAPQDLFTFAADDPVNRLEVVATAADGTEVRIFGHERFGLQVQDPRRDHGVTLRLGGINTQNILNQWWDLRTRMRPLTEIVVGTKYQPGWVDTDLNLLASAIEKFGVGCFLKPREKRISDEDYAPIAEALKELKSLNKSQTSFVNGLKQHASGKPPKLNVAVEAVAASIGTIVGEELWVVVDEWETGLIDARNGIAHGDQHKDLTPTDLHALLAASWCVLSLALARWLGAPDPALKLAANQISVRYGPSFTGTRFFRRPAQ